MIKELFTIHNVRHQVVVIVPLLQVDTNNVALVLIVNKEDILRMSSEHNKMKISFTIGRRKTLRDAKIILLAQQIKHISSNSTSKNSIVEPEKLSEWWMKPASMMRWKILWLICMLVIIQRITNFSSSIIPKEDAKLNNNSSNSINNSKTLGVMSNIKKNILMTLMITIRRTGTSRKIEMMENLFLSQIRHFNNVLVAETLRRIGTITTRKCNNVMMKNIWLRTEPRKKEDNKNLKIGRRKKM